MRDQYQRKKTQIRAKGSQTHRKHSMSSTKLLKVSHTSKMRPKSARRPKNDKSRKQHKSVKRKVKKRTIHTARRHTNSKAAILSNSKINASSKSQKKNKKNKHNYNYISDMNDTIAIKKRAQIDSILNPSTQNDAITNCLVSLNAQNAIKYKETLMTQIIKDRLYTDNQLFPFFTANCSHLMNSRCIDSQKRAEFLKILENSCLEFNIPFDDIMDQLKTGNKIPQSVQKEMQHESHYEQDNEHISLDSLLMDNSYTL